MLAKILRWLTATSLALCVVPAWCATPTTTSDRMIDVGGRRLHLTCAGVGAPTIIFESGLGEGAYSWALVQNEIATRYRACSYDRSGIGFSDPDDAPRSVTRLINDLHELLSRSGERGPFLLVGHSLGGLLVRRYAMTYPTDVAGLVLLDSAHEDAALYAPRELTELQARALAARAAQLKEWHASGRFEEMTFHDKLPARLTAVLKPRSATASWWDARFAENDLPGSHDALTAEQRRLTIPLVVITATAWPRPQQFPAAAWEQQMESRMRLQRELASRSSDSKQIFAPTGHHIQFDDPKLVVRTITELAQRLSRTTRSQLGLTPEQGTQCR